MTAPPPPAKATTPDLGGKIVVIGVFVVALAAASFALWWNINRARRSLEFWGKDAVRLIQHGKAVELLELQPAETPANSLADQPSTAENPAAEIRYQDRPLVVKRRLDLSQARGLVHARHALTDDASFVWDDAVNASQPATWDYAIRFSQTPAATSGDASSPGDSSAADEVLLLLDLENRRLANVHGRREVTVIPKISEGWQIFLAKQLGRTSPARRP
jgi:hypothetical protein